MRYSRSREVGWVLGNSTPGEASSEISWVGDAHQTYPDLQSVAVKGVGLIMGSDAETDELVSSLVHEPSTWNFDYE